ncbi:hypothetical protein J437_LFUL008686 [Ladona fulva]|uniref:Dynein regulatory complex protein 10 n=1 Tax=Ladona fulva TaxID=123851 RepID=A0A8K0P0N6_LADFU|nr:hypothetical protein J437_LFUL008686 [Ladona fulva]
MDSIKKEDFNTDITIRSERVMNILNDTVKKIETALTLSEFALNLDRYKHLLSEDELNILLYYIQNGSKDKERSENGIYLHGNDNCSTKVLQPPPRISIEDFELNYSQSSSYDIAEPMLQKAIELLCKKKELSECINIKAKSSESRHLQSTFLEQICALRDNFEKILLEDLSYDEEEERTQHYKEIWKKNEDILSEIEVLRPSLANITSRVDNELKAKDDELRELYSKIEKVKSECQEEIKTICMESEMKIVSERVLVESKKQILLSDIRTQEEKLQDTLNDDLKKEKDLRAKRYKIETQLESLIGKYDADMGTRQEEFEHIKAEFDEEERQLSVLEENFSKQSVEYNALMEEKAEEERMELERKIEDLRSRVAARIIQTRWRDLKRRRLERAKMRKGKKGKGKKKSGKNSPSPKRPESATTGKKQ